jgi:hypothetical protein
MPRVITPEIVYDPLEENTPMGAPEDYETEALRALRKLYYAGELPGLTPKAFPVFAMGVVGGVVGAKLLKGTLGLAIGAGLAYYAWSSLQPPPEMKLKEGAVKAPVKTMPSTPRMPGV